MAVYSLFCPSPGALLQFSFFFRCVVFATFLVEGLGRTKKREAGVEVMFQVFLFLFMSGFLILCIMWDSMLLIFVLCVLIDVMCVVCDHVRMHSFWFVVWLWCVYDF